MFIFKYDQQYKMYSYVYIIKIKISQQKDNMLNKPLSNKEKKL